MDTCQKHGNGKSTEYEILTREEADRRDISFLHWKQADEGEWAISDDGYIAMVIKRKTYTNRHGYTRDVVTVPFDRKWVSTGSELLYEEEKPPKAWLEKEVRRTRFQQVFDYVVAQLATGHEVDWHEAGKIYRSDQEKPHLTVQRLFRERKVRRMVQNELLSIFSEAGLTPWEIAGYYKTLLDAAQEDRDHENMIKALEHLVRLLDMKPEQATAQVSSEMD